LLAFSALGFGVGLSNFGEGYSSLGGIGTLGITHICVSDAFTREVGRDESDDALLATIASLSKAMGCRSIGSRVSSQRQLDVLKAANFDLAEVASEGHQTDP
jgi:EAL domain-containing protein (putative c-di-GMP-specific phosphodiesterase class I)